MKKIVDRSVWIGVVGRLALVVRLRCRLRLTRTLVLSILLLFQLQTKRKDPFGSPHSTTLALSFGKLGLPTTDSVHPSYLYVFWPWGVYRMPAGFGLIGRSTTYYFWKVITQTKYSRFDTCKHSLNYVRVDINLRGQSLCAF